MQYMEHIFERLIATMDYIDIKDLQENELQNTINDLVDKINNLEDENSKDKEMILLYDHQVNLQNKLISDQKLKLCDLERQIQALRNKQCM